jgi:hypothetical protein
MYIHPCLKAIRTHDPSVRTVQHSTPLRYIYFINFHQKCQAAVIRFREFVRSITKQQLETGYERRPKFKEVQSLAVWFVHGLLKDCVSNLGVIYIREMVAVQWSTKDWAGNATGLFHDDIPACFWGNSAHPWEFVVRRAVTRPNVSQLHYSESASCLQNAAGVCGNREGKVASRSEHVSQHFLKDVVVYTALPTTIWRWTSKQRL